MPGNRHTSVRSRRVAAELRRIREEIGLSCGDVARKLGMSVSKVSRIETGVSGMQVEDIAALLGLYQVPASLRDDLLDSVKRSGEKNWWERQSGLPKLWKALIEFESKATRIQNFELAMVPGLLQTDEYARALMRGVNNTLSDEEVDNLVASRMSRQALLIRKAPPQFLAVVDESALTAKVGEPGVMRRQLQKLVSMSERPNVTIRAVPRSVGAYGGLRGAFVILEFLRDDDLVHVENQTMGMFLEEETDLASYRLALSNILAKALAPDATRDFLAKLADEAG